MNVRAVCLLTMVALLAFPSVGAVSAVRGGARTNGYPGVMLTTVAGVRVSASFVSGRTPRQICPRRPFPLSASLLRQAATAVARAMPALYRHARRPGSPRIDAREARSTAGPAEAAHAGTSFERYCGPRVWKRSAFVAVRLPHVRFSASLSHPSFEVARTPVGWVIWAEVH
jgi:hypothetical protein